jgi:uncharacterized SAM-binding protein YcdF (DUF218 family)
MAKEFTVNMGKRSYCLFLASLSLTLNSCLYYSPTSYLTSYTKKPYDVIIVAGFPYDSVKGKWSELMKMRVYWSLYLYKNGIANNIIYSGSAVYTPYVESQIMAMYGEALGIRRQHIFIEERAEHSTENLYYSYHLAKKMGFKKIAIASDPFQLSLLKRFPRKMKIEVDFIPISFEKLKEMEMKDVPIEAEKARMEKFISLVKRESRWKRFMGTLGKNYQRVEEDSLLSESKRYP